ncbi:MAG: extensin family protein [Polyangiaceae bacterium]|nr:extensin family protein [Polyangiaceae bacterium]
MLFPSFRWRIILIKLLCSILFCICGLGTLGTELEAYAQVGSSKVPSFREPLPEMHQRLKGKASSFANLSPAQCRRRLKAHREGPLIFERGKSVRGIATSYRLLGSRVAIDVRVPSKKSEIALKDCRFLLTWIELVPMLQKHNITAIRFDNFYRRGAKIRKGKKSQHSYGLAADIGMIQFGEQEVEIKDGFLGKIGSETCGPEAVLYQANHSELALSGAKKMRDFICDLARKGSFHHLLTPNYNAAHAEHLHFDIQRDNRWCFVK